MTRDEALALLRTHADDLRRMGVLHAGVFGSVARGEQAAASDVDLLVEVDPDARLDVFDYVGVVQYLEDLFPAPVDVANRECLKPMLRAAVDRDARYAF